MAKPKVVYFQLWK